MKFRHSSNPSFVRLHSSLSSFRRRTSTGMSHDLYVSEERFLNLPSVRRFINRPTFQEADTSTRNVGHFCTLIVEFEGTDLYLSIARPFENAFKDFLLTWPDLYFPFDYASFAFKIINFKNCLIIEPRCRKGRNLFMNNVYESSVNIYTFCTAMDSR